VPVATASAPGAAKTRVVAAAAVHCVLAARPTTVPPAPSPPTTAPRVAARVATARAATAPPSAARAATALLSAARAATAPPSAARAATALPSAAWLEVGFNARGAGVAARRALGRP